MSFRESNSALNLVNFYLNLVKGMFPPSLCFKIEEVTYCLIPFTNHAPETLAGKQTVYQMVASSIRKEGISFIVHFVPNTIAEQGPMSNFPSTRIEKKTILFCAMSQNSLYCDVVWK